MHTLCVKVCALDVQRQLELDALALCACACLTPNLHKRKCTFSACKNSLTHTLSLCK
jgi:hypothetical protein